MDFSQFFELSNDYMNMEDAYSQQEELWTITGQDAYIDPYLLEQTVFIITQKLEQSERNDYVINQIRLNETEFKNEETYRSKANQAKYHRQFKITDGAKSNCADRVKATADLLVVYCKNDKALTVYRRQRDQFGIKMVNYKRPILEISGSPESADEV